MAAGVLVAAVPTNVEAAKSFPDVKPTHHFYEAVLSLTERGVINGYEDGTYRPGQNISRAHAAKIMAGALNLDTENVVDPGFKDIPKSHPYYGHIAALVNAGIIKGYEDNTFRPTGNLTRAHVAQMLVLGYEFEEQKLSNLPFTDINNKQWHANYIQTLFSNEITTGTTPTTFSPNAFVTRGQVASFIYRSELATQQESAEVVNVVDNQIELSDGTFALHADLQDVFNADNLDVLKGATVKYTVEDGVIVAISSLELKANGTAEENLTLDGKGATFAGDITVSGDYIVVKNLTIAGKTSIANKAKTAAGAQYSIAAETASPTVIFIDVTMGSVVVTKDGVTINFKGNTKVSETIISSNVVLKADAGVSIPKVTVNEGVTKLTLDVNVDNLTVNTTEKLTVEGTGNIKEATIESKNEVSFDITGKVDKLTVESKDATINLGKTKVGNLNLPAGTEAKDIVGDYADSGKNIGEIGGKTNPDAGSSDGGSTGGGGGGGGSTPTEKTPQEKLNEKILNQLNNANLENDPSISIVPNGKVFNVTIKDGTSTLGTFEAKAAPIYNAFKEFATVSSVTVSFKGEQIITKTGIDNSLTFKSAIDKTLVELNKTLNAKAAQLGLTELEINISRSTTLSILEGEEISFNVTGTIDGVSVSDTYTFNFVGQSK